MEWEKCSRDPWSRIHLETTFLTILRKYMQNIASLRVEFPGRQSKEWRNFWRPSLVSGTLYKRICGVANKNRVPLSYIVYHANILICQIACQLINLCLRCKKKTVKIKFLYDQPIFFYLHWPLMTPGFKLTYTKMLPIIIWVYKSTHEQILLIWLLLIWCDLNLTSSDL